MSKKVKNTLVAVIAVAVTAYIAWAIFIPELFPNNPQAGFEVGDPRMPPPMPDHLKGGSGRGG